MDAAFAEIIKVFINQGVLGAVVLGAAWWINKQQNRMNEMTDKVMDMSAEQSKAIEAMTGAITRLTDNVRGEKVS